MNPETEHLLRNYLKLLSINIRDMPNFNGSRCSQRRHKIQKKLSLMSLIYIGFLCLFFYSLIMFWLLLKFWKAGFIFTWLPYSFGSMYIAFIDKDGLGPTLETLPAMFAKSSMVWSTCFYLFSNKQFRAKISFKLFFSSTVESLSTTSSNTFYDGKNANSSLI